MTKAPLSTSGTPSLGSDFVYVLLSIQKASKLPLPKNTSILKHCSHPYSKPICLSALFSQQSDSTIYNTFLNWRLNCCLHFPSPKLFTLLLSFPLSFMKTSQSTLQNILKFFFFLTVMTVSMSLSTLNQMTIRSHLTGLFWITSCDDLLCFHFSADFLSAAHFMECCVLKCHRKLDLTELQRWHLKWT